METSKSNTKSPSKEVLDFLAVLDADFGKKKKDSSAAALNKKFHEKNPSIDPASGKAPELDMSGQWKPIARVTYVTRQTCGCCNNTVEFIGGEYIMWESKRQHARILRDMSHSAGLYIDDVENPLEDLVDEFNQTVTRCPGCIAVERQAEQIWGAVLKQQQQAIAQQTLDFDLSKEIIIKEKKKAAATDTDILNIKIEGV